MKINPYLFLIISFIFISCSSDDETSEDASIDPIIGEWGEYQESSINSNGNEVLVSTYEPYLGTINYSSDGTFEDNDGNSGTWENLGDGRYSFDSQGFTLSGTIEFICDDNVHKAFSPTIEGEIYYFELIGYDNTTCDEDNLTE
jgi:hypothetical protein